VNELAKMYYPKKSKEVLCAIFLFALIIPTSIIATITPLVYAQTNQSIAENEDLLNMQDIPAKRVLVGDIDIAYKMFVKVTLFYLLAVVLPVLMGGCPLH